MAGGTPAIPATLERLFRLCFFDQHYRDAVDYWVQDFALRASEMVGFL